MFNITAAYGKDFVNRTREMKEMLGELENRDSRIGFAIYGRRRLGKTSLFRELERRLSAHKSLCPIYFSMWDLAVKDIVFFSKRLTEKILEPYRRHFRIRYATQELFEGSYRLIKSIISGLKIGVPLGESIEFLLSFDRERRIDVDKLIDELFRLPDRLAHESDRKSILLLDEFPDITTLKAYGKKIGPDIVGKLRTINEEYRHTSFNIAGSIRSTMDAVALSPQSAFYRQFMVRELEPFDRENVYRLLKKNIAPLPISAEAADEIYRLTSGIPLYVQYLGRILIELGLKQIALSDCRRARDIFLNQDARILLGNDFNALSEKERYIVIEIAKGNETAGGLTEALKGLFTNLSLYLKRLVDKGALEQKDKDTYDFADPLFKEWVRRTHART